MTGRPLRPVTDHRLGEPLPHQLANRTQAPPQVPPLRAALISRYYAVLAKVSLGCPPLEGRFLRVPHPSAACHQFVLLRIMLPLDLHVLGVPPAFNLSHDQTLHFFITRRVLLTSSYRSITQLASGSRRLSPSHELLGLRAHSSLFQFVKDRLPEPRILPNLFSESTLFLTFF